MWSRDFKSWWEFFRQNFLLITWINQLNLIVSNMALLCVLASFHLCNLCSSRWMVWPYFYLKFWRTLDAMRYFVTADKYFFLYLDEHYTAPVWTTVDRFSNWSVGCWTFYALAICYLTTLFQSSIQGVCVWLPAWQAMVGTGLNFGEFFKLF